jgi:hypothetical protein
MGKTYRIGTWKVPDHIKFDEKPDIRKTLAVLKCLSGVIDLREVLTQYPELGIEINGVPVDEKGVGRHV